MVLSRRREREREEEEREIMPSIMATLLRWRTHSARTNRADGGRRERGERREK